MEEPAEVLEPARKRPRGIYLLPNLFTTAALFAGFYAVLAAAAGRFEAAALAVFAAMLLDGFDGRVARLTHTQTAFGAEYDSLSDMVAFGVAPALVAYHWALGGLGKLGWLAAFVYTAAAALRLARFNTQAGTMDKRYFQGLPSPSAAAIVAGAVWIGADQGVDPGRRGLAHGPGHGRRGPAHGQQLSLSVALKQLNLQGRVPFMLAVGVMLAVALIVIHPPVILFLGFMLYAISGPVWTLVSLRQRRARRRGRRPGQGADGV